MATVADPLLRADASFSKYPLNMKTVPQAIGRLVNGADCDDDMILCEWEDAIGTKHIVAGELLAIKIVNVANFGDRNIPALGIGTARRRGDVMAKVSAFLPEVQIECLEDGEAGEGEGIASCSGAFASGGWIKLLFNSQDKLISARIDAFQIN